MLAEGREVGAVGEQADAVAVLEYQVRTRLHVGVPAADVQDDRLPTGQSEVADGPPHDGRPGREDAQVVKVPAVLGEDTRCRFNQERADLIENPCRDGPERAERLHFAQAIAPRKRGWMWVRHTGKSRRLTRRNAERLQGGTFWLSLRRKTPPSQRFSLQPAQPIPANYGPISGSLAPTRYDTTGKGMTCAACTGAPSP